MKTTHERGQRLGRSRLLALTGLAGSALAVLVAATVGTAAPKAVPAVTAPPTISGTAKVGSTLTANNGTWSGGGTMTFTYQWRRCDKDGGSCSDISGATERTYELKSPDQNNTLRVRVTARNADGATAATTVPTALVAAADTPAPAPTPSQNGCPNTQAGQTVNVTDVSLPARLLVDRFQPGQRVIPGSFSTFTVRIHVGNTCGHSVRGAMVYAPAVPFNQVVAPQQTATGDDGWVELTFRRDAGFPAARRQQLMVLFVRATKPGEPVLAGISTRRLISLPVNLGV
jgi:hypothetical protein